eukprot:7376619-Prymnesium_polylepis.1
MAARRGVARGAAATKRAIHTNVKPLKLETAGQNRRFRLRKAHKLLGGCIFRWFHMGVNRTSCEECSLFGPNRTLFTADHIYSQQKCPPGGHLKTPKAARLPRSKLGWPRGWVRGGYVAGYVATLIWDAEKGRALEFSNVGL